MITIISKSKFVYSFDEIKYFAEKPNNKIKEKVNIKLVILLFIFIQVKKTTPAQIKHSIKIKIFNFSFGTVLFFNIISPIRYIFQNNRYTYFLFYTFQ